MSKQLSALLEKAKLNSKASVNGRMVEYDFGYTYTCDLEEKWAIEFDNEKCVVQLRHWGTELIAINHLKGKVLPESFYAQSKSDIDGINWFLSQFPTEIDYHAHYFPSRETAELHNAKNEIIKEVK